MARTHARTHTHIPLHTNSTHLDLDFLYHGMDVQHGTVAGTDDGLVLQDGDLGIEYMPHVAGVGGVTQNEARRDVLGFGNRSTDKHTTPALIKLLSRSVHT